MMSFEIRDHFCCSKPTVQGRLIQAHSLAGAQRQRHATFKAELPYPSSCNRLSSNGLNVSQEQGTMSVRTDGLASLDAGQSALSQCQSQANLLQSTTTQ